MSAQLFFNEAAKLHAMRPRGHRFWKIVRRGRATYCDRCLDTVIVRTLLSFRTDR